MLVLRKELKMGLGIGAAVLGVATVYGLMSLLSSGGGDGSAPVAANNGTDTIRVPADPRGLESARSGLPPAEGEETAATGNTGAATGNTGTQGIVLPDGPGESARSDGNADDKWTIMFNTGRMPDATPVRNPLGNTPGADTATLTHTPPLNTGSATGPSTGTTGAISSGTSATSERGNRIIADPRTPAPAAGKYVVQPGDTYSSIAGKVYGNRNLYQVIEKANPSVDPRKIRPGMELNVPAKEAVSSDRGSVDVTPPVAATGTIDASREYRVQPGDTLHKISQRLYGKTNRWAAIYDLNKTAIGPDAGKLKVGTVLTLPEAPTQR